MPVHRPETVTTETKEDVRGRATRLRFSDDGGLTQFGALVEVLAPGARSALKHWHSDEDELVYMLDGEVLVHEGDSVAPLRAGEVATFRAGDPVGHCLENASDREARYLIIGTRAASDTVTYPDDDRIQTCHADGRRSWSDLEGRPADNPYLRS